MDFIHLKLNNIKLDKIKTIVKIIGPKYEIAYNKKINSKHTNDLIELKKWSSDHKAVFANIFFQ